MTTLAHKTDLQNRIQPPRFHASAFGAKEPFFKSGRFLFWTEDCCGPRPCGANRMHAAVDDRYYSYYAYDHSGERRLKLTGDNKLLDVNADFMATYTILNEPTLYPSAYMVLTNNGYTKHYYAGAERVAARLGGGGLDAMGQTIGNEDALQEKSSLLFDQSLEQACNRVLGKNDLGCIMRNQFAREEFGHVIDGTPSKIKAVVKHDCRRLKDIIGYMLIDRGQGREPEVFFYHSDHLGSASWITDHAGDAVQHLQYLPYGEPYINQRLSGYNERFSFTGKERDEETGYGYFGARYMDHELMTMWLSVDPRADKYSSLSPYNYCAWNPVKLVDPDGRDVWEPDSDGNLIAEKGDNAWTLAAYLNTTPKIAINMLEEQGYSVNSKGVLNLKEGNLFKVDYGEESKSSDVDLGKMGNIIRQKAGSGIAEDLFTNFWNGDGDITLTGSQFAGILMYIKESNQSPSESDGNSKTINFYNSREYALAFGRASITVDSKQRITGFSDIYNFDSKKAGIRSSLNEFKTRAVNFASKISGNGKNFEVSYP